MKRSQEYADSSMSFQPTPTLPLPTGLSEIMLLISYGTTYLAGAHALDLPMKSLMNSRAQTGRCFEKLG
jgi:hypothetical protein